jgi:hypothetical protein
MPHLLKSPDAQVKVGHITTAPALVGVVVVGVVAGAGVSDLHNHTATSADTVAVQLRSIPISHGLARALDLIAGATGASIFGVGVCKGSNIPPWTIIRPDVVVSTAAIMD